MNAMEVDLIDLTASDPPLPPMLTTSIKEPKHDQTMRVYFKLQCHATFTIPEILSRVLAFAWDDFTTCLEAVSLMDSWTLVTVGSNMLTIPRTERVERQLRRTKCTAFFQEVLSRYLMTKWAAKGRTCEPSNRFKHMKAFHRCPDCDRPSILKKDSDTVVKKFRCFYCYKEMHPLISFPLAALMIEGELSEKIPEKRFQNLMSKNERSVIQSEKFNDKYKFLCPAERASDNIFSNSSTYGLEKLCNPGSVTSCIMSYSSPLTCYGPYAMAKDIKKLIDLQYDCNSRIDSIATNESNSDRIGHECFELRPCSKMYFITEEFLNRVLSFFKNLADDPTTVICGCGAGCLHCISSRLSAVVKNGKEPVYSGLTAEVTVEEYMHHRHELFGSPPLDTDSEMTKYKPAKLAMKRKLKNLRAVAKDKLKSSRKKVKALLKKFSDEEDAEDDEDYIPRNRKRKRVETEKEKEETASVDCVKSWSDLLTSYMNRAKKAKTSEPKPDPHIVESLRNG
jgi:hypothetical protein